MEPCDGPFILANTGKFTGRVFTLVSAPVTSTAAAVTLPSGAGLLKNKERKKERKGNDVR